jgi:hypothetical protein
MQLQGTTTAAATSGSSVTVMQRTNDVAARISNIVARGFAMLL